MDFNLNNVIRSATIVIVGLPISLGASGFLGATTEAIRSSTEKTAQTAEYESLRADLTGACLKFALSKVDSKLERNAKNDIDENFGDGADYREVCKWVLQ